MIQWFEGYIADLSAADADPTKDNMRMATVQTWPEGYEFKIQLDQVSGYQTKPSLGDKITFYTDSSSNAKFGFKLADSLPHSSPIWLSSDFQSGEIGIQSRGTIQGGALIGDAGIGDISDGAWIWLRNNGDGHFCSGSGLNVVEVNDSSKSINIVGQNVDIYARGNAIVTHAFNIDSSSLGVTTLNLGVRNPFTGLWVTRLTCETDGAWGLGAFDPLLGSQLGGFAYNLVPKLPLGPLLPNTCKITSIPFLSQITIDPLGTSINGPTIMIAGTATPIPGALPLPALSITMISGNVGIISTATEILGTFHVIGATTITGTTTITGATAITGVTAITGATKVTGILSVTGGIDLAVPTGIGINYFGADLPAVGGFPVPAGYIPAIINGKIVKLPYYL
jgi:hypothetical protein